MTKTTNYQLNQWAKSDRIRMDDFNADNAKIDAALATRATADSTPWLHRRREVAETWTFSAKPILIVHTLLSNGFLLL